MRKALMWKDKIWSQIDSALIYHFLDTLRSLNCVLLESLWIDSSFLVWGQWCFPLSSVMRIKIKWVKALFEPWLGLMRACWGELQQKLMAKLRADAATVRAGQSGTLHDGEMVGLGLPMALLCNSCVWWWCGAMSFTHTCIRQAFY